MKKKNLAIYALVGAMAISPIFTSCVDSEETQSVTSIRNAKAEQLKAIADLNNAKAASTTAMAAADAALINAKAEAQKAQKEYNEAMEAWYKTQDEEAKAALEVTIKQAEKDLARIQGEIDKQAINIQAALLQAEYNLMVAQKNLENATKGYDDFQKAKLQTLAQEYSKAVTDLIKFQKELTVEKSKLVKLETGLMKAEEALEATIAANNNQIALNNIQIEALKKYTNYTEDTDALYLEYLEANAATSVANEKMMTTWDAFYDIVYTQHEQEFDDAIEEAMEEIEKDEFYKFVDGQYIELENEDGSIVRYNVWDVARYFKLSLVSEANTHKYEDIIYTEEGGNCGKTLTIEYEMTADIRTVEMAAYDATKWRKQSIATWNEDIKTKKTELATAETATATAKKAWDDAAAADKEAKKAEYQAALDIELGLKKDIENLQSNVEYYTNRVAAFDKALDMAKNADKYNEALQAKVKAYNEANVETYAEILAAWDAWMEAQAAYYEASTESSALWSIYYDANDNIAYQINELEEYNNELLEANAKAEKLLTQYEGYEIPYEVVIEFQKEWVAVKEAIVKAQEVKVEEAKKALDAAMPAEEEEGTEAPEEGTEETPAE